MRAFLAFMKKEWMELVRTGKLWILLVVFVLFGIMNPAIAKLTPWMMEMFEESFAQMGMSISEVQVDALTSWGQFYKNVPMALVVFLLMFSGTMTSECQKGTLIPILTKGMERWKVVLAKTSMAIGMWTICYWMCYAITYGYNWYFWDNGIAHHPLFAAFCLYLAGTWLITLMLAASGFLKSNSAVLIAAGAVFLICYFTGMVPKFGTYLPTQLLGAGNLLSGAGKIEEYLWAIAVTGVLGILNLAVSVIEFDRKEI